jgi:hypothetical protein
MTGEEALQEIKSRKDALAKQAQSNLNANYNIYSDYLSKTAQNENKGALNSYQNYPAIEGTDSTRARSAYLNRLASANDAYAEGMRGLNLYRNKLGANMDAASLNADATINGLEYKNALYNDQMAYQRERDAVADAQWQKNFDLGYLSSTGTSGGGRSYGGGGYYSDPTPPQSYGASDYDNYRTQALSYVDNNGNRINTADRYYRYAYSLAGRAANAGQGTADQWDDINYQLAVYNGANGNSPVYDNQADNIYNMAKPSIAKNTKAANLKTATSSVSGATKSTKKIDMTK